MTGVGSVDRRLTFILTASPYSGQTAATVLKLARTALDAGIRPTIFATGDGVYGFVRDQKATAVFDMGGAAEAFVNEPGRLAQVFRFLDFEIRQHFGLAEVGRH